MIDSVVTYVRRDFVLNPIRACAELLGMAGGVGAAILLALTTPMPMMKECYVLWLGASGILFLCSLSRGSTGLALAYASYFLIDVFGFIRTVL